jgi:hypothetical protein
MRFVTSPGFDAEDLAKKLFFLIGTGKNLKFVDPSRTQLGKAFRTLGHLRYFLFLIWIERKSWRKGTGSYGGVHRCISPFCLSIRKGTKAFFKV